MAPSMHDVLQAKRAMSTQYLTNADGPRFASLTMHGVAIIAAPEINVHAVGVGSKLVDGKPEPVPSIRFYVIRKMPLWTLGASDKLPDQVDGIPTDVIESPPASFAAGIPQHRAQMRPVQAGVSISHPAVAAGTLGAICRRDPDDGVRFALSNNHVLANLGLAKLGDTIVQPSPLDQSPGGQKADVARLHRFEPILTNGTRNRMDAALAEFLPGMAPATTDILHVGRVGPPRAAAEGMRLVKSGRTTFVTHGEITDASYDVQLPLQDLGLAGSVIFEDVLRIEGKGRVVGNPGDSGALFVTDDAGRNPVGLMFASGGGGGYALASPIDRVLAQMAVVIV